MKADWTLDAVIRNAEMMLNGYQKVIPGGIRPAPGPIPTPVGVIRPQHVMFYPNGWQVYWGALGEVAAYVLVPPEVQ